MHAYDVHVCLCAQNMYMYAYGYTQHFLIVIYWQLNWFIDWHEKELKGRMGCFSGSSLCEKAAGS